MNFVNREKELALLEGLYARPDFQFVPIYGRRRIGKTRLVREFIQGKRAVYFLADSASTREQLKNLGRTMGDFFGDLILADSGFQDWLQVFRYIRDKSASGAVTPAGTLSVIPSSRFVFVLDEYPYLANAEPAIASIFQKGIEEFLKTTDVFLILLGSSIGMMEREVLAYKAPLYGRRTASLKLTDMRFASLRGFFPGKAFDELVDLYSVFGTVPAYLELIDPRADTMDNIRRLILETGSYLYNEVEFLLREELREPRYYFVILRALAQGKTRVSEIGNETGFEKSHVSRYLDILQSLNIVGREVPATEKKPDKSKQSRYRIKDRFMAFWFKYIYPHRSLIEIGRVEELLGIIRESFENHAADGYEEVCREFAPDLPALRALSYSSLGRWWSRMGEIDLVAVDDTRGEILFGECKWSRKKVGEDIYQDLKRKSELVDWRRDERTARFVLFSRSGFTEAMVRKAQEESIILVHGDKQL